MLETDESLTPTAARLCEGYEPPPAGWDEMSSGPCRVRAHWEHAVRALDALGAEGLGRRAREARRLIRESDVTYTVYSDRAAQVRPWELDLVPLLLTSEEWAGIEAGLAQRAELLNLVLADLYGRRELIRHGLLPADLVFSHPGFLRACDGTAAPAGRHLILYAVDLARRPDGQVQVLADRAQVPSGAGYALQNRVVLSRLLPSLFRDSQVHRLALFFRAVRRALAALAPPSDDPPRVVVLTPGPRNEAYFEHAYLAAYLGYTLAQGGDLSVRGERVFLKTLDGLQPVDVILRRLDDDYCDPLELREDSVLGVPGLVQAARAGRVTVANPLGSGFLDNPALLAYLPALARHLLGEDLILSSVETWWCGTREGLSHVLANLERLVVKPVSPGRGMRSVFGATLSAAERDSLAAAIRARPERFVGEEVVQLSTAPTFDGGRIEARHVVMRGFLVGGRDGYEVMPGGLTRAAPRAGQLVVSNQVGGISKDTWVLASEPERQESLLGAGERRAVPGRAAGGLPSRVADDLFWVGRYAERAEALVRLARVVGTMVADGLAGVEGGTAVCVAHLLRAVTHMSGTYPGFVGPGADRRLAEPEPELLAVLTDPARLGGLTQSLQAMLNAARAVRDRLSSDTWRVVSEVERHLDRLSAGPRHLLDTVADLEALVGALAALAGLTAENMRHGQAWAFLELGRRIERTIQSATLLRATLVPPVEPAEEGPLLEGVLAATDSLIAYRQRYRTGVRVDALVDLLVLDEDNPRALAYQLQRVVEVVARLPRTSTRTFGSAEERLALEALTVVRLSDPECILARDPKSGRTGLEVALERLQRLMPAISDAVGGAYLRHDDPPRVLLPGGAPA